MLTTIRLYGHLRQQFGAEFQFHIDTVAESIRALSANLPGFRQYLLDNSEPGYRVIVDDNPVMAIEELGLAVTRPKTIKIVPVVAGADDGKAIGQIIVGIALAAATLLTGGAAIAGAIGLAGVEGAAAGIASAGISLGLGMMFGGISSLLITVPDANSGSRQSDNKGFSNGQDTIVQSRRVPIGCGRMLCTGLPISVRLVVEDGEWHDENQLDSFRHLAGQSPCRWPHASGRA